MTQFAAWVSGKSVPFQRHRYSVATDMQEGVADAGDYKATQRAAGANMSVDVAIGKAWVGIDTGVRNGLGFAFSDAVETPAVGASHATLPRLDQVVLQWNDSALAVGVGGDIPTVRVIAGTPTAGATLDNRNGAAALPADCIRLADVLVPAASTSVVTANIRDRRRWARGAQHRFSRTSGNIALTTTMALIDSTNMNPRIEIGPGGNIVDLVLSAGLVLNMSAVGQFIDTHVFIDGVAAAGADAAQTVALMATQAAVAQEGPAHLNWPVPIAAPNDAAGQTSAASGSHLIGPAARFSSGTSATVNAATRAAVLLLREQVRQTASNT